MGIAKKPSAENRKAAQRNRGHDPAQCAGKRCRSTERGDKGHAFLDDWNSDRAIRHS
jgi:hypothetical protein